MMWRLGFDFLQITLMRYFSRKHSKKKKNANECYELNSSLMLKFKKQMTRFNIISRKTNKKMKSESLD